LDAENVSIDGKEIERNNGQAVSSFVATSEENPLKVDDIETSVVCGADNKLNGTVSATVISNAASAKNVTVTADYYEVRSGKKAASYAKEVQLEAGMNMESFSFENLETEFSETEGLVPMFCKLTVTDEDGNSVDGTVDGITVTLTKKTDPTDPTDPEVAVEKIIVMPEELTLLVGESAQLNATVLPENASDKKLVYTALNGNVSVTQDGKVTANRVGTSRISISSSNGKNAVVSVTVKEKTGLGDTGKPDGTEVAVTVKKVTVKKKKLVLKVGQTVRLKVSILPKNATDKRVSYKSSNKNVKVSKKGYVTGKKAGKTKITIKSMNGKKTVVNVTVKKDQTRLVFLLD
ncbi:MAG: Ig-like domain-containing protein, partial [Lachnospiraceae bacterium]|nr:Ig-like domain-containing protein [Lachnospiraceae bacterium]